MFDSLDEARRLSEREGRGECIGMRTDRGRQGDAGKKLGDSVAEGVCAQGQAGGP